MNTLAQKFSQKWWVFGLALLVALSLLLNTAAQAKAASSDDATAFWNGSAGLFSPDAIYTLTNAANGNAVAIYDRGENGQLRLTSWVFTGGNGTGANLGSQQALTLENGWVFAVNAGSNTISVLKALPYGLYLTDTVNSGGVLPVSVTAHDDMVYVLNAGDANNTNNITGFRLNRFGKLAKIENSTQPLSDKAVGPAQVAFSPNGRILVVTEKGTNKLDSYVVNRAGQATNHKVTNSAGTTPFGFSFDGNTRIVVSEAFGGAVNGSAASSYKVSDNGDLTVASASVATHQTAACWVVVTPNGKFAYTGNPTSDSLTGYTVAENGQISLLNSDGKTGSTAAGSAPEDMVVSRDGKFLYALDVKVGKISGFSIGSNGQLTSIGDFGGLPTSSVGLTGR